MPFADLPAWRPLGVAFSVRDLPQQTDAVAVVAADGRTWPAVIDAGRATIEPRATGTHAVEARDVDGRVLAEALTTVSDHPADRPVPAFVTSYEQSAVAEVLGWLRALRCTTVQFYDWMADYAHPLGPDAGWEDPLGRPVCGPALRALIAGVAELGAAAQAYAPVYAIEPPFAATHPEWLLYRGDGAPESLGDLLQIADPANVAWQQHWIQAYGRAADALGFHGFHLDSYGYPRAAVDSEARPVALADAYPCFLHAVRAARPVDTLSFNQVNGVPRGLTPPDRPTFRYVEVWPPNDRWRHLEGLLARSAGTGAPRGDTLAIYPTVWESGADGALATVVRTEAVATVLGASCLLYGDRGGVLRHPYYPDYMPLDGAQRAEALRWHTFALRCRDLFADDASDTSWYDVGDENGGVRVHGAGRVAPEPCGGVLFCRVTRTESTIAVSLLDLTGSEQGSWMQPTTQGRRREATVEVLVDRPDAWRAAVAALGRDDGRFSPAQAVDTAHREGRALAVTVPILDGWSVVRLTRRETTWPR